MIPGVIFAQSINFVSEIDSLGTSMSVVIDEGYAFIAGEQTSLCIVDVSDPEFPSIVGTFNTGASGISLTVRGNYCYFWDWSRRFYVLDVSDLANPVIMGQCRLPDTTDLPGNMVISGDFAYVSKSGASTLAIIDFSDPANPFIAGTFIAVIDKNFSIYNNVLFAPVGICDLFYGCHGGIYVFDLSDPISPEQIAHFITDPNPCIDLEIRNGIGYLGTGGRYQMQDFGDFRTLDVSDPTNISMLGYYQDYYSQTPFSDVSIGYQVTSVISNYGFLLEVLDVSDPSYITLEASADLDPFIARTATLSANYIYLSGAKLLRIYHFDSTTDITDPAPDLPSSFFLSQNYPNPFNAKTTISFDLPEESPVMLEIYNVLGRKIETLLSGTLPAGSRSIVWNAENESSGIYYYKLESGKQSFVKSCNFIK